MLVSDEPDDKENRLPLIVDGFFFAGIRKSSEIVDIDDKRRSHSETKVPRLLILEARRSGSKAKFVRLPNKLSNKEGQLRR